MKVCDLQANDLLWLQRYLSNVMIRKSLSLVRYCN